MSSWSDWAIYLFAFGLSILTAALVTRANWDEERLGRSRDIVPPMTEAEQVRFNLTELPLLNVTGARKVASLFRELDVLGPWQANVSFLLDLNTRLVRGGPVVVDSFLTAAAASGLRKSFHTLAEEGNLEMDTPGKPPIESTGLNISDYDAAQTLARKCEILEAAPFRYRYHEWNNGLERDSDEYPALDQIHDAFNDTRWAQAWNLLLSGSGFRLLRDVEQYKLQLQKPSLRDWMPGDYLLFHNDRSTPRVLSFTIWLPTVDWKMDWGGNLIWCGAAPYSSAQRILAASNRAVLFVPHSNTWHAVEVVKPAVASRHHRFALSSALETHYLDDSPLKFKHAAALETRQAELTEPRPLTSWSLL